MNPGFASLVSLLFIAVISFLALRLVSTRRNSTQVHGFELFNPLAFNFLIYTITCLAGSFAVLVVGKETPVNTLVDGYATFDIRLAAFLLMVYGFLLIGPFVNAYGRRTWFVTIGRNGPTQPERPVVMLVSLLLIFVVAWFTSQRLVSFQNVLFGGGDAFSVLLVRANLVHDETSTYFIQRLFVDVLAWTFCLYLAQDPKNRLVFVVLASLLALYFLASLTKIKLVFFILSIVMVLNWNRKLSMIQLLRISAYIIILLIVMWSIFVRNLSFDYLFSLYSTGLLGRIFISQISSIYPHLEIFGNNSPHIGFGSLSSLITSVFDLESSSRSGRIVLEAASPNWLEQGFGGVYNTVYFGEAFANFGITGVIVAPLIVLVNYFLLIIFARLMSKTMAIAFFTHTAFTFSMMEGINDFLWNPFLVANIFFLISLRVLSSLYMRGRH